MSDRNDGHGASRDEQHPHGHRSNSAGDDNASWPLHQQMQSGDKVSISTKASGGPISGTVDLPKRPPGRKTPNPVDNEARRKVESIARAKRQAEVQREKDRHARHREEQDAEKKAKLAAEQTLRDRVRNQLEIERLEKERTVADENLKRARRLEDERIAEEGEAFLRQRAEEDKRIEADRLQALKAAQALEEDKRTASFRATRHDAVPSGQHSRDRSRSPMPRSTSTSSQRQPSPGVQTRERAARRRSPSVTDSFPRTESSVNRPSETPPSLNTVVAAGPVSTPRSLPPRGQQKGVEKRRAKGKGKETAEEKGKETEKETQAKHHRPILPREK